MLGSLLYDAMGVVPFSFFFFLCLKIEMSASLSPFLSLAAGRSLPLPLSLSPSSCALFLPSHFYISISLTLSLYSLQMMELSSGMILGVCIFAVLQWSLLYGLLWTTAKITKHTEKLRVSDRTFSVKVVPSKILLFHCASFFLTPLTVW